MGAESVERHASVTVVAERHASVTAGAQTTPVTRSTNSRWMRRSPVISGWNAVASLAPWRTATT
ncbi:hypothetical protein GBP94_22625 [Mycobacterium avium subsp. hominissuis]|nr:hypothetical protein [Mycobacterium avium subsp. hominissuis]MBZ4527508.1 hypothetical protein [Mycobacterium avium subsp. hominissuis]MBZ4546725.1 hypothetical protein [Mycobacterium avium subsp. hominissuis]MBZ4556419.1 hypothetical protein [Mycobacterium avium subsp. hominissuis]MBZ4565914.1 hypothetical protein [Mycobacterium avium subsp. hominissuis]